ncbi:MAG: hypothetical protein M3R68_00945 [Acidobacteriota bacterium]|nr:hypothetical protein [Acidobacteriota bacterium]
MKPPLGGRGVIFIQALTVKTPTTEIRFIVLVALIVAAQEAVPVSQRVAARAAEDREKTGGAVFVEVRALRVIGLPATAIVRAGVQAILIALIVSVGTISKATVIRRLVRPKSIDEPCALKIVPAHTVIIPIPATMVMMISITVAIPVVSILVITMISDTTYVAATLAPTFGNAIVISAPFRAPSGINSA